MKKLLIALAAFSSLITSNSFADDGTVAKDGAKAVGKSVAKNSPNATKDAQDAKKATTAVKDADSVAK